MKNIYYSFWVSLIKNYLSNKENAAKGWEKRLLLTSSILFGISLQALFVLLEYFKVVKLRIEIHVFSIGNFNSALVFTIINVLPLYIINYYLFFYKEKYISLMDTYKGYSKKKNLIILLIIGSLSLITLFFFSYLIGKSK